MESLSLREIAVVVGAAYSGDDAQITDICSDSRAVTEGCLFVALTGERFDGHDYVKQALEQEAAMAVVMRDDAAWPPERLLRVQDTRRAMLDIAGLYRREMGVKVVAVTGSVGKTTTKEMIACVVAMGYKTLKTQANLNNEIGLSQTIFGLTKEHEAAVLEMGMDGPGQIAPLSHAAAPDIAVLTNIGVAHLEALGSRENILREKLDITAGMPEDGKLIVNADDNLLVGVKDPLPTLTYGIGSEAAQVRAVGIRSFSTHTTFEIRYNGRRYDAQIPTIGEHNVYNALAAFCVGILLSIEPHRAIAALRDYKPTGMRQNVVNHCGFTVIEDCYNASPDSMTAAMKTLGSLSTGGGRRIAVLADMLELGTLSEEAHREAGRAVAEHGIDLLFCTGPYARLTAEAAKASGMREVWHCETVEELFAALKTTLHEEDVVWVKASRAMRLEQLLKMIYSSNF